MNYQTKRVYTTVEASPTVNFLKKQLLLIYCGIHLPEDFIETSQHGTQLSCRRIHLPEDFVTVLGKNC
jgi:hypothetical protein